MSAAPVPGAPGGASAGAGASGPGGSGGTASAGGAQRSKGYNRWDGELTAAHWRWWVIASGNLRLAWASRWVKIVLIASLMPGVILAGITYFFIPLSAFTMQSVFSASTLFAFLVTALVGARLISEDRRQGAFLAHFARPVTRLDYVAGKMVALIIPLLFVTMAPALFGLAADIAVDADTIADRVTAQVGEDQVQELDQDNVLTHLEPGKALQAILTFGLVASVTTAAIMLGLSALTTRARMAGISWFALVAFGGAASGILGGILDRDWPAFLSWTDNVGDVGAWALGLDAGTQTLEAVEGTGPGRIALLVVAGAVGLLAVYRVLSTSEAGEK